MSVTADFAVQPGNFVEYIGIFEVLVVNKVDFTRYGKVFDGYDGKLLFLNFVKTGTVRQNRNAEVVFYQFLYNGNIVHFHYYVKVVDGLVVAVEIVFEKRPRTRPRQPQNKIFLFEFVQRNQALFGQRIVVADGKHEIVGVQKYRIKIIVLYLAVYENKVQLVGF